MNPVDITVKPAGPIVIQGDVVIRAADGTLIEPPRVKTPGLTKLCGCGRSRTRPFCDGSHKIEPRLDAP